MGSGGENKTIHSMSSRWKIHKSCSATFVLVLFGLSLIQSSLVHAAESESEALGEELDDIADLDKDDDDDLPPPSVVPAPGTIKAPDLTESQGQPHHRTAFDPSNFMTTMEGYAKELPDGSLQALPSKSRIPPFGVLSSESDSNKPSYPTVELGRITVSRPSQPLAFSEMLSKKIDLLHQKLLDQIVD